MFKWYPEAIPDLIAIFYNKVPAKAFRNFYQEVAREVGSKRRPGRLLDVGTGPGHLPIEIAGINSNLDIVGIDLSPKMIGIARENAKRKGIRNITFELADANELPFEDDIFDFVLSTVALHHWYNRKKIFRDINRVLKKDGICWIYDLRKDASKDEIRKTLKKPVGRLGYIGWAFKFHGLKTEEYLDRISPILKEMNLREFNIEKKNAMMRITWTK